jgi:hypothetical protein
LSVLFGDIELAVVHALNDALAITAYTMVPKPRVAPFLIVQRVGGPTASVVHEDATITVESWGKADKSAHDNMQLARQAIHDLPKTSVDGLVFYRVQEFSGPARLPPPDGTERRFVQTFSITVRGLTSS